MTTTTANDDGAGDYSGIASKITITSQTVSAKVFFNKNQVHRSLQLNGSP